MDLLLQALRRRFDVTLVLLVLLFAECEILISFLFGLGQGLPQAFHLFLEVFNGKSQLELRFGQAFSEVANDCFTLLHLAHVRLSQSLDLILMRRVQLVDLVLSFLFTDDGLASVVLE